MRRRFSTCSVALVSGNLSLSLLFLLHQRSISANPSALSRPTPPQLTAPLTVTCWIGLVGLRGRGLIQTAVSSHYNDSDVFKEKKQEGVKSIPVSMLIFKKLPQVGGGWHPGSVF